MNPDDASHVPQLSPDEETAMQAEIELALEPYRKIAPPSLIPVLRESLENALRTHPVPRQLLRAFAPRTPVVHSGDSPIGGAQPDETKAGGEEGA